MLKTHEKIDNLNVAIKEIGSINKFLEQKASGQEGLNSTAEFYQTLQEEMTAILSISSRR